MMCLSMRLFNTMNNIENKHLTYSLINQQNFLNLEAELLFCSHVGGNLSVIALKSEFNSQNKGKTLNKT